MAPVKRQGLVYNMKHCNEMFSYHLEVCQVFYHFHGRIFPGGSSLALSAQSQRCKNSSDYEKFYQIGLRGTEI